MKSTCFRLQALLLSLVIPPLAWSEAAAAVDTSPEAGFAVADITPEVPIRLAGYAGRKRPADKIADRLVTQALALKNSSGERFVLVTVDNCELSRNFLEPVMKFAREKHGLQPGSVAVVSSHTHSAPVLADTLPGMPAPVSEDARAVAAYSDFLRARIEQVITGALGDFHPASFEHGVGKAGFAMNRRVYRGDKVQFGDNPDGPTDHDVPVLKIKGTNGAVRGILFGYACHGTTVRLDEDWYSVSGEYMAHARRLIETNYPGAVAMYVPGFGADSDPFPRGTLLDSRRHGLELAGAVIGVLDRPMQPTSGSFQLAYKEIDLPLVPPPSREQVQKDVTSQDNSIQRRAHLYAELMDQGKPLPTSVKLPLATLRLGDDLTFVFAGGEVVVDYSKRLKRALAAYNPWLIAYAYDVPCYIPSFRIIREGGYEAEASLTYYGLYGPFHTSIEEKLVQGAVELTKAVHP